MSAPECWRSWCSGQRSIRIDALGLRAQPLRFLDVLWRDTIVVSHAGLDLRLPHPASFALHKLIVSRRRAKAGKKAKDVQQGLEVMDLLSGLGRAEELRARFLGMPAGWRRAILKVLVLTERRDLADMLRS